MGFLPFVNQGGRRMVRWHRLLLAWVFIMSATLFGSCTMGFLLTGDWQYGVEMGLALGIVFSAAATVLGFTTAVGNLPSIPPRSSSGGSHGR